MNVSENIPEVEFGKQLRTWNQARISEPYYGTSVAHAAQRENGMEYESKAPWMQGGRNEKYWMIERSCKFRKT